MVGGGDWLLRKLDLVLVDKAMLSKSLIQFFADGWGYFLCSRDNGNGDYFNRDCFQKDLRLHAGPPRTFIVSAPDHTVGHR